MADKPARQIPWQRAANLAALLVLLVAPALMGGFWTYALGVCFANAIAVLSVSFLVRYSGEVSLGHGVFVAAGAYTAALLERHLHWPVLASLPVAALVGAMLAAAFAWPSRRLSGIYLAVVTMALALALPEVLLHFSAWTGGFEGLNMKLDTLPALPAGLQRSYVPFAVLCGVGAALHLFRRSRQGIGLLLMRTSVHAAESFGMSRSSARVCAMAASGGIAGIAGAMLAFSTSTVGPSSFTLWTSIFLLVGSVVSLYVLTAAAGLIGALFLTAVPLVFASAGAWVPILYGAALLLTVLAANVLPGWLGRAKP
ncbi:branched-chain amino acid ABC transporter permease [soil metagenome]